MSFAEYRLVSNKRRKRGKKRCLVEESNKKKKNRMKKKDREGKRETGITCGKLITVSLEKNSSRVAVEEKERSEKWKRRGAHRGEEKKKGKETEGRQGDGGGGKGMGEEARECQQRSCVDVNKGGRISFRRTAICEGSGYVATSSIHKESCLKAVCSKFETMTDGWADGEATSRATQLRNFAPKRLLRHYTIATRAGTKSGTWGCCLDAAPRKCVPCNRDQTHSGGNRVARVASALNKLHLIANLLISIIPFLFRILSILEGREISFSTLSPSAASSRPVR